MKEGRGWRVGDREETNKGRKKKNKGRNKINERKEGREET